MKDKIILLFLCLVSQYSYTQSWDHNSLKVIGEFANSAQVGSKAILYLSFYGGYSEGNSEYDESIGSLRFELYEYNNNPADFYRKYKTLGVNMTNGNGKFFISNIMSNEFHSLNDNEFSMTQYLYPTQLIRKNTQRKDSYDGSYQLIKPTYDVDFKIIEEIIYKKQLIELVIFTDNSTYNFKFKSLGLEYPNSLIKLIEEAEKKTKKELIEKEKIKDKENVKKNKIKELMLSPYIDNLSETSLSSVEDFLYKLKDEVLFGLTTLELSSPKPDPKDYESWDRRVLKSMFKKGNVSLNLYSNKKELDIYSEDIFNAKDELEKFQNSYQYKYIRFLKLKPNSEFINYYELETKNRIRNFYSRVESLFKNDYGGKYLKDEIKFSVDAHLSWYNVRSIETISFKFSKEIFEYKIKYSDGKEKGVM